MTNRSFLLLTVFLGIVGSVHALDPLEQVEQDQTGGQISSHDIFNRNIALDSMREYTDVSSYKPGGFGFYAHDGNMGKAWVVDPNTAGATIEVFWGLAVPVDNINVTEKNGGSIQALTLELYDGQNWEKVPPHDPRVRNRFAFPTRSASALRITIDVGDESAGIAEVEVYNTQSDIPLKSAGSPALVAAMRDHEAVIFFDGSPYGFSRAGRKLINPRVPEACLTDSWTPTVLEYVVTSLGGTVENTGTNKLDIRLGGHSLAMEVSPKSGVLEQLAQLAEQAGLEFLARDSLVMVGQGLQAFNHEDLAAELEALLGRNPYRVDGTSKPNADAIVTPTLEQEGITYEWAGFRSDADPDTNIEAWLKYAGTKSARSWVGAPKYMNRYIRPEKEVESVEEFEALTREIRAHPETNSLVAMKAFMNKYHEQLSAEFAIYNRLGIDVINETGPKDWPDTLHEDFIQWAGTYSTVYYLAKNYHVAAHQFGNEPDWYFNQISEELIARRLTLVADAVHAAIEDVNRDYKRNLKAIFSAPVLAGDFQGRSARVMMRNLYTRYDGTTSTNRLFQLFNRHRYSGRPHQNALEVRLAKNMMQEEAGEVLPQVFTELNFSTARNWRSPNATYLNDTPAVFTSIAGIWGWMMQEQGVYGIFVFKLNDPGLWNWNKAGRFSNIITYSMFPEQDPGTEVPEKGQIQYGTKNFEVCRLFGRGFHGSRPLLRTDMDCSDLQYRSWTTYDEADERFYIWSVQVNDVASYEIEFDLSKLNLPPNALVTAETVSGARHGEVTRVVNLPEDQKIRIHQAPQSAMLLTVHKRALAQAVLYPEADATVLQSPLVQTNLGAEARLGVERRNQGQSNRVSFLRFDLPEGNAPIQRAVLELHGHSVGTQAYDGGFLFRVYAIEQNDWDELGITADTAPNLYKTVPSLQKIDLKNYPVGHVTCFNTPSKLRVDVTRAVQEARDSNQEALSLVLIREIYWPDEDTEAYSAVISARESGEKLAPKLYLWE